MKFLTMTNVVTFSPILLMLLGCLLLPSTYVKEDNNMFFVPMFDTVIRIKNVNNTYYIIVAYWWLISLILSMKIHISRKSAIYVATIIILLFVIYGIITFIISRIFLLSSCLLIGSGMLTLVGAIYVDRNYYNNKG